MTNKARAMLLLRYLREHTDEDKAVTHTEIRKMLREKTGSDVPVATIRADVKAMIDAGYHISVREVNGVATYYKYLDHPWKREELQILIDAVASGHFISPETSAEMIRKLQTMAAPSDRDQLAPGIHVEGRVKAKNGEILAIVQEIQRAIANDRRIRFKYYEYTREMKRIPKHDGYRYEVSPYALLWAGDRYYLVGWSEKHNDIVNFRVDRMGKPEMLAYVRNPVPEDLDLEGISEKVIAMYRGPERTVTLRLKSDLLDQVIDQFGENLKLSNIRKDSLDVTVRVHVSPTFFGWLFQYVGEMTLTEPEDLCQLYAEKMQMGIDEVLGG